MMYESGVIWVMGERMRCIGLRTWVTGAGFSLLVFEYKTGNKRGCR
jgi:hypothetical protein